MDRSERKSVAVGDVVLMQRVNMERDFGDAKHNLGWVLYQVAQKGNKNV